MTEPFVGEIQIFAFPFAPYNWSFADGSTVAIRQYTALYALIGTAFGGDGVTTFMLPNLAARGACGTGQSPGNTNRTIGQTFGTAAYSLQAADMPAHTHMLNDYQPGDAAQLVATPTTSSAPGYSFNESFKAFAPVGTGTTVMNSNALGQAGAGSPHENRQPFLALNHSIALVGDFPQFD